MLPDLWNSQWNVVSVIIMSLMVVVGLYQTYRHNLPFSLKKLPFILTITMATQFVFYETLDLLSPLVYSVTRVNPVSAFVEIFSQWVIVGSPDQSGVNQPLQIIVDICTTAGTTPADLAVGMMVIGTLVNTFMMFVLAAVID